MGKRLVWIDIARGIAIILVIIGHSIIGYRFNDVIFTFHIPLFFVISGYTFRDKPVAKMLWKNIKRILVPYIITCICVAMGRAVSAWLQGWTMDQIHLLVHNTCKGAVFGFGVDQAKGFTTVWSIGAIWYLLAYFWATLFFNIIIRMTKNKSEKYRAIVILCTVITGWLIGRYIWLPTNVDIGLFAVGYMYVGHLLAQKNVIDYKIPRQYIIPMVIIFGVTAYYGGVNMVIRFYPELIVAFAGSVIGSIFVMRFSNRIEMIPLVTKVLGWFGRNSLSILCVHLFEIMIIPWDLVAIKFNQYYNWLVLIQFRTIFCIIVVLLLNLLKSKCRRQKSMIVA